MKMTDGRMAKYCANFREVMIAESNSPGSNKLKYQIADNGTGFYGVAANSGGYQRGLAGVEPKDFLDLGSFDAATAPDRADYGHFFAIGGEKIGVNQSNRIL